MLNLAEKCLRRHQVFYVRHADMEVYYKSAMETFFSHLHFFCLGGRGHVISGQMTELNMFEQVIQEKTI